MFRELFLLLLPMKVCRKVSLPVPRIKMYKHNVWMLFSAAASAVCELQYEFFHWGVLGMRCQLPGWNCLSHIVKIISRTWDFSLLNPVNFSVHFIFFMHPSFKCCICSNYSSVTFAQTASSWFWEVKMMHLFDFCVRNQWLVLRAPRGPDRLFVHY